MRRRKRSRKEHVDSKKIVTPLSVKLSVPRELFIKAAYSVDEQQEIYDRLYKPVHWCYGFDTKALNYKLLPLMKDMLGFADTKHDLFYGAACPGAEVSYCILFMLFICKYPQDERFVDFEPRDVQTQLEIAYRCCTTLMMCMRSEKPQANSIDASHALDTLILNKKVFYIDYTDEKHKRILKDIDESWGYVKHFPRDMFTIPDYYTQELDIPLGGEKGPPRTKYANNLRTGSLVKNFHHLTTYDPEISESNTVYRYLNTECYFERFYYEYLNGKRHSPALLESAIKAYLTKNKKILPKGIEFAWFQHLIIKREGRKKKQWIKEDPSPELFALDNLSEEGLCSDIRGIVDFFVLKKKNGVDWEIFLNTEKEKIEFEAEKKTTFVIPFYIGVIEVSGGRKEIWYHCCSIVIHNNPDREVRLTAYIIDSSHVLHMLDTELLQKIVENLIQYESELPTIALKKYCPWAGNYHQQFLANNLYTNKRGECVYFNLHFIMDLLAKDEKKIVYDTRNQYWTTNLHKQIDWKNIKISNIFWYRVLGQLYETGIACSSTIPKDDTLTSIAKYSLKVFMKVAQYAMYDAAHDHFSALLERDSVDNTKLPIFSNTLCERHVEENVLNDKFYVTANNVVVVYFPDRIGIGKDAKTREININGTVYSPPNDKMVKYCELKLNNTGTLKLTWGNSEGERITNEGEIELKTGGLCTITAKIIGSKYTPIIKTFDFRKAVHGQFKYGDVEMDDAGNRCFMWQNGKYVIYNYSEHTPPDSALIKWKAPSPFEQRIHIPETDGPASIQYDWTNNKKRWNKNDEIVSEDEDYGKDPDFNIWFFDKAKREIIMCDLNDTSKSVEIKKIDGEVANVEVTEINSDFTFPYTFQVTSCTNLIVCVSPFYTQNEKSNPFFTKYNIKVGIQSIDGLEPGPKPLYLRMDCFKLIDEYYKEKAAKASPEEAKAAVTALKEKAGPSKKKKQRLSLQSDGTYNIYWGKEDFPLYGPGTKSVFTLEDSSDEDEEDVWIVEEKFRGLKLRF